MKLRHVDQAKLQNRPNTWRFSGPNQGPKEAKTHRARKKRTRWVRAHHVLPVEGRTTCGGGTHGRAPCTHGRACPGACGLFRFSSATLHFSAVFAIFLLIMLMYLAYWVGRIHRIDSLTLSKTPLEKEEEEEGCGGKRRCWLCNKLSKLFFLSFIFLQS